MKTIGLLGGTGWTSTITYYTKLNQLVNARLGGYHSAKILLKSVDYHDIMNHYGQNHEAIEDTLCTELLDLISMDPDCFLICCNSLHKYYDMIKGHLYSDIPIFHAVELVAEHLKAQQYKKILLLATPFTLEDGFFAKILEEHGLQVVIPIAEDRIKIGTILDDLLNNTLKEDAKTYFKDLIASHTDIDAVVLGCTEFPLIIDENMSSVPLVDPVDLQVQAAVEYALGEA
jgi:aspartate racemase